MWALSTCVGCSSNDDMLFRAHGCPFSAWLSPPKGLPLVPRVLFEGKGASRLGPLVPFVGKDLAQRQEHLLGRVAGGPAGGGWRVCPGPCARCDRVPLLVALGLRGSVRPCGEGGLLAGLHGVEPQPWPMMARGLWVGDWSLRPGASGHFQPVSAAGPLPCVCGKKARRAAEGGLWSPGSVWPLWRRSWQTPPGLQASAHHWPGVGHN